MLISKNGRPSNKRKFLSLKKLLQMLLLQIIPIEIKKKNNNLQEIRMINVVDIFGDNVRKCDVFVDEIINLLCTYL